MCLKEKINRLSDRRKDTPWDKTGTEGERETEKGICYSFALLVVKFIFFQLRLKFMMLFVCLFQIIVWLKKSLLLQSEKSQKRDTNITANMTEYVDIVLSDLVFQCKQSKELIKSGLVTLTREILILRMCNYRYDYWWKGGKDNHYMSTVAILCLIMFDICRLDLTMS